MVLTTYELNLMRDQAINHLNTNFTHIAIGSGTTTPSISDTALTTETLRKPFQETTGPTSGVYTMSMRIAPSEANGTNIEEIGVFDDSSSGNNALHKLTTSYAKTNTKEVWIDIQVTITAANS